MRSTLTRCWRIGLVSVLFNEPKLLKSVTGATQTPSAKRFSALQRAEIAEIRPPRLRRSRPTSRFSALQRAEIAEISTASTRRRRA